MVEHFPLAPLAQAGSAVLVSQKDQMALILVLIPLARRGAALAVQAYLAVAAVLVDPPLTLAALERMAVSAQAAEVAAALIKALLRRLAVLAVLVAMDT
ncbi:hypothetical protein D9M70_581220 [compost metagenome]